MSATPPAPHAAPAPGRGARRRRLLGPLLGAYAALFVLSSVVRAFRDPAPPAPGQRATQVEAFAEGARDPAREVLVAWRALGPEEPGAAGEGDGTGGTGATGATRAPALLLHGSPGRGADLAGLAAELARERPVLVPDLPGSGRSTRDLPDHSARAHADYVLQLLEREGLPAVHVVGYSMGGAVALELSRAAPERVRSLTLLSALGVQELELFGDHTLNRGLHAFQYAALWLLREATPHFGWLDDALLSVPYARNFLDTDQRPLRAALEAYGGPALVLHGERDPLVPVAAAREHHRLLPQAELVLLAGGHVLVFQRPAELAVPIGDFLARVERGAAATRAQADPARVAAARAPFDPAQAPALSGLGLALLLLMAAAATLVSEDLACIGVGALVAQGRVPFWPGAAACFVGIYVGDVLLFLAGRVLGRRALRRAPLSWLLDEERVERGSRWFEARGPIVILASRFLPGARLPTYFAAGLLRTSIARFALWFALAAGLWTPLLVGLASAVGSGLGGRVALFQRHFALGALATLVLVLLVVRVGLPLLSHRGRRLLVSRWRRLVRWEFWPAWAFYPPVVLAAARAGLAHRSPLAFTAANPAIPLGGFVGESKRAILAGLAASTGPPGTPGTSGSLDVLPRTLFLPASAAPAERLEELRRFRADHGLGLPLVVKPDVGQRGTDVVIAHDERALERAVASAAVDVLVQEHVPGVEYGIFYARRPSEERGRVISLAEKRLPAVAGDGVRTLERLILDDERAVCMAPTFLRAHAARLDVVPRAGERVLLGELGTHCRGALFLDAGERLTPALEEAVERVARALPGFCFGRFDVRAASPEDLEAGRFRVLELNGVTSESAHVYDPRHSVLTGWRTIAAQWRLAYAIGAENAARGAPVATAGELLRAVLSYRRLRSRARVAAGRAERTWAASASHAPGTAPAPAPSPGPSPGPGGDPGPAASPGAT